MRWALLAAALLTTAAAPRSGHDDASPATQAMQDEDAENPGFLWVAQGMSLWGQAPVTGGKSCASCHGDIGSMRGVAARYPAFDAWRGQPLMLFQRINLCRTTHQGAAPLEPESDALLSLEAAVGLQSRGLKLSVPQDGAMKPFHDAGERLFRLRQGQLNLACQDCHDTLAGQKLAGSLIPQGHPNGYPLYRLEWQSLGSLYRRIRNCLTGVRAEPFGPESPELVAIAVYLAGRASGLDVETPAVRP